MNQKQKMVILAGAIAMVLMGLIPPWKYTFKMEDFDSERPARYDFIFSPPLDQGGKLAQKSSSFADEVMGTQSRPSGDATGTGSRMAAFYGTQSRPSGSTTDRLFGQPSYYFNKGVAACGAKVDLTRLLIEWISTVILIFALVILLKPETQA